MLTSPTWPAAALLHGAARLRASRGERRVSRAGAALGGLCRVGGRGRKATGGRPEEAGGCVAAGLGSHAREFIFRLPKCFRQVLASQIKNPHFSLAQMLGERPLYAACALRHAEHFPEWESVFEVHILQNCYPADIDHVHAGLGGHSLAVWFPAVARWVQANTRQWVEFQRDLYPKL